MFDDVIDAGTFHAAAERVRAEPYGTTRCAQAEALLAAAERVGDTALVGHALVGTIVAYNYGGESPKSAVSMGRLLRLFDTQPASFDEGLTHYVFWYLKWVTSSLLSVPEVPLATIRRFLDDLERRYRTAGHSMRPVHKCRFYLYDHTGDKAGAAREFEAWLAADRDALTDCDACERREQGRWLTQQRDDARALEIFGPTLSGARSCAEEPQITLSDSLIPLVRLDRLDEARANHLRGYRMVRGQAGMHDIVGRHIEFCALTGNEGRGVEIVADHRLWLSDASGSAMDRLEFLGGVVVLLRRLVALGRGDLPVTPMSGTDGTAAGILAVLERELAGLAARFDERNGSDFVGATLRERLGREPLADSLPLGVRSALTAAPAARPAAVPPPAAVPLDELLADARALDAVAHPRAHLVWEQYARAVEDRGAEPPDRAVGELALSRGLVLLGRGEAGAAMTGFRAAAEAFDRAGLPGKAAVARSRAIVAALHPDAPRIPGPAPEPDLDAVTDDVTDLVEAGRADDEDLAAVLMARATAARMRMLAAGAAGDAHALPDGPDDGEELGHGEDGRVDAGASAEHEADYDAEHEDDDHAYDGRGVDHEAARDTADIGAVATTAQAVQPVQPVQAARAAAEAEVDRLAAVAERLTLPARQADVAEARAHFALLDGDREAAVRHLRTVVDLCHAAGRPWQAVQPGRVLGSLLLHQGDWAGAELAYLAVHDAARDSMDTAEDYAEVLVGLANSTAPTRPDSARDYAVRAAHEFDRLGDRPGAAYARRGLAELLQNAGRAADAVAVLEESLPDIAEFLGEEAAWHARRRLAAGLAALGDGAEAADVLAALARDTAHGGDAEMHAEIAAEAALALARAGRREAADRAFGAAIDAMRPLDRPGTVIRLLRAAGWNLVENRAPAPAPGTETAAVDRGIAYFAEAAALLDAAAADGPDLDRALERADTEAEWTEALWTADRNDAALALADRAAARLEITLPRFQDRYTAIVTIAARIEHADLDMPALAITRIDAALAICRMTKADTATTKLTRIRNQLTT
ncbi:hypothetical protein OG216_18270 [Streptomycetaceae bacterium NBC_01309]